MPSLTRICAAIVTTFFVALPAVASCDGPEPSQATHYLVMLENGQIAPTAQRLANSESGNCSGGGTQAHRCVTSCAVAGRLLDVQRAGHGLARGFRLFG